MFIVHDPFYVQDHAHLYVHVHVAVYTVPFKNDWLGSLLIYHLPGVIDLDMLGAMQMILV